MAVQQWRRKVSSSPRCGLLSTAGLCREPGLTCCVAQMYLALEKECCCIQEDIKFLEPLAAIPRGGIKKLNKLKALKTSSEYNHLRLSMERYVLSGNFMAEVILHSWGVKCAVLRDLLCFAEERRVAFLSFRRKRCV